MDKEELKQIYASIHTLRMEGDYAVLAGVAAVLAISIHTLRVEGDLTKLGSVSTVNISIHTLPMEGDNRWKSPYKLGWDFNPHPPRGG